MDHNRHIPECDSDSTVSGPRKWDTDMVKTVILIILFFTVPGVIMGIISSYRAGQKPHEALYLRFKKFAQRKNK